MWQHEPMKRTASIILWTLGGFVIAYIGVGVMGEFLETFELLPQFVPVWDGIPEPLIFSMFFLPPAAGCILLSLAVRGHLPGTRPPAPPPTSS